MPFDVLYSGFVSTSHYKELRSFKDDNKLHQCRNTPLSVLRSAIFFLQRTLQYVYQIGRVTSAGQVPRLMRSGKTLSVLIAVTRTTISTGKNILWDPLFSSTTMP